MTDEELADCEAGLRFTVDEMGGNWPEGYIGATQALWLIAEVRRLRAAIAEAEAQITREYGETAGRKLREVLAR